MKQSLRLSLALAIAVVLTFLFSQRSAAQEDIQSYTKVGQKMPAFTVTDTDSKTIDISALKGKVVVVNFWATWCGPCEYEMPRLEQEVWQKHRGNDFAMVAIAREQTDSEIVPFRRAKAFTFPIAADPDRSIFKKFGNAGIPRSYVVGIDGVIVFQSEGYNEKVFDRMTKVIEEELKKAQKQKAPSNK